MQSCTKMYATLAQDVESEFLWDELATKLPWFETWEKTLDWSNQPFAKWFVGGKINASYACLDVHIKAGRGANTAILWENEQGQKATLTYQELYDLVNRWAFFLQCQGVKQGDVVILYLPMVPEAIAIMLATARLGAPHCVVFSGFSAQALADRIKDTNAQFVVTADYTVRRGKYISLKQVVDQAVDMSSTIKKIALFQRFADKPCTINASRDVLFNESYAHADVYVPPVQVESNHMLFILYTSGTTGKPKGIMHGTGGYLTYVYATFKWAFGDVTDQVYWCTADIGWITGHSYVTYAPLMHGCSVMLYEGALDFPTPGIWWELIERYKISILYTSPTALRMCRKYPESWITQHDLSSLKVLGSVGEPINPEVWTWYFNLIGNSLCPIIDTWWQTETGGFMIAPTAGIDLVPLKAGSATMPLPGICADVVDAQGSSVQPGTKGYLVIKKPWPGMMLGVYNDPERFLQVYWSKFEGMYYPGDYAIKDNDGYFWLLGRADEVLNIAGHRIGTAELESATLTHPAAAEAAVVGIADQIRGEVAIVFVILKQGMEHSESLKTEIVQAIRTNIGAFAAPAGIYFVDKLPKTRSGKIMRRLLKAVVDGSFVGDISTLEDEASVQEVSQAFLEFKRVVHEQK